MGKAMYRIDGEYVLCSDKRVIAKIKGEYDEQKIDEEINKYVDVSAQVKKLNAKKYNGLMPLSVYLFPTSDCNLRCKYCYSDAGEICHYHLTRKQIDAVLMEASKTAYMVSSAAKRNGSVGAAQEIWFAGGGEPTWEWDIFEYAVEKAKSLAEQYKYEVKFGILTNGNGYTEDKIKYIIDNFSFVQVSFDGTKEIQNIHRPAYDNSDSFDAVDGFVKALMHADVRFGLRSTVSDISVNKLEEITEYFASAYPTTQYISFEPLSTTERSTRNNFVEPSVQDFVENFKKAMKIGKKHNIIVATSLLNISQVRDGETFCDSSGGTTCVVQPNGYMTGCTETMPSQMDSVYSPFVRGKVSVTGVIENYNSSQEEIYNVEDKCKNCEFLSFCQGDCPLIRLTNKKGHLYRCAIKKLLIKDFLLNMISETDEYTMQYQSVNCDEEHIVKICSWGDDVMNYRRLHLEEVTQNNKGENINS